MFIKLALSTAAPKIDEVPREIRGIDEAIKHGPRVRGEFTAEDERTRARPADAFSAYTAAGEHSGPASIDRKSVV